MMPSLFDFQQQIRPWIKDGITKGESKKNILDSIEVTILSQPNHVRKSLMRAAEKLYNETIQSSLR